MCLMLKNEYISCLHFKTQLKIHEKQNILLMILNEEESHYLAVRNFLHY